MEALYVSNNQENTNEWLESKENLNLSFLKREDLEEIISALPETPFDSKELSFIASNSDNTRSRRNAFSLYAYTAVSEEESFHDPVSKIEESNKSTRSTKLFHRNHRKFRDYISNNPTQSFYDEITENKENTTFPIRNRSKRWSMRALFSRKVEFPDNDSCIGFDNKSFGDFNEIELCTAISHQSIAVASNSLGEQSGRIRYISFSEITDFRLLPRHFQHHNLTDDYKSNFVHEFEFFTHDSCPNSPSEDIILEQLEGQKCFEIFTKFKFFRQNLNQRGKIEFLCRFCPAKRWFDIENLYSHLSKAHGIFCEGNQLKLLPSPSHLFELNTRKCFRTHVKCPCCCSWVRLGHPEYINHNEDETGYEKPEGLFVNYFNHLARCSNKRRNDCL
ncbi:hypothetical protein PACTADRAFT_1255 [Pachysolen tannophilus NRRL Y-2460]|uniref:Transcription regulator Rua1 C-terminal domain-containing protein n=1 Tax=Pachysolen tannophilus NRRL Y-2460 TaxID=669874 RepID=A0A1E4TY40_PACTA|nr:hypothetical protein PACTADRAFT_1255 [Pachysolen tannophilus NRRL Y-2460]